MKSIKLPSFAFILCLCGFALNASEKKTWTPLDTLLVKQIYSIQVSPDGSQTLLRISEPTTPDKNPKNIQSPLNTYIISNKTQGKVLLDDRKTVIGADWSYDGKWIAYSTGSETEGAIWVKSAHEGKAKKVFESPIAGSTIRISPDGRKMIVMASVLQDVRFNPKLPDSTQQLYILSFDDNNFQNPKFEALTPEAINISTPTISWSPDSRYLAVSITNRDWRAGINSSLAIIDVETKKIDKFLSENRSLTDPIFSPNQRYIAYVKAASSNNYEAEEQQIESANNLCLYDVKMKKHHCISGDISSLMGLIGWTADSQNLLYKKWDKTRMNIHQINIEGTHDIIINKGLEGIVAGAELSHNNKYLGFVFSNMTTPQEAYYTLLPSFKPHQLTNMQDVSSLKWLKSEVVKWKSFDGLEIEGILTYPTDYKEGTKVPLLIWIHGGPSGISNEQFQGETAFGPFSPAVLASAGYAVLQPNYRGSMGYGVKFSSMSFKDFGGGDFKDILSGIDYLVEKSLVDPNRIVIGGWSYGGFLSAWATTHDQRFQAAIVGAGPIDWYSNMAASDNSVFEVTYMGRYIKDWFKMSPLMTIKNIKTPILIQHGLNDRRVPSINAIEFSYALKRLNVPHKTIIYVGQGHHFNSDLSVYQAMNDQIAWVKSHISPYKP